MGEITDKINELLKEKNIHLSFEGDYTKEVYTHEHPHLPFLGPELSCHEKNKKFFQGKVTIKLGRVESFYQKIPVTEYSLYFRSKSVEDITYSHCIARVYPDMKDSYQKHLLRSIIKNVAVLPENSHQEISVTLPLELEKHLSQKHLDLYQFIINDPKELSWFCYFPPHKHAITEKKEYLDRHYTPDTDLLAGNPRKKEN